MAEPWLSLARRVYVAANTLPVLYSPLDDGQWVLPKEAVYVSGDWEVADDIEAVLTAERTPVVRLPERLRAGFDNVPGGMQHATPEFMRRFFESRPNFARERKEDALWRGRMVRLLEYCFSDMILGCPADTDGGENYRRMCGLPIVPAANGDYLTIRPPCAKPGG